MRDSGPLPSRRRRDILKLTGVVLLGNVAVESASATNNEEAQTQIVGSGTSDDPFVISSADDLHEMDNHPNSYFVLDSDIDASSLGSSSDGFNPIDDFAGNLDGQGNEISGLRIDRENEAAGLFSNTLSSATISNLGVVDVDIVGGSRTGAVVGDNNATIRQTYASGRIESNASNVGGLVGRNSGDISESFSTVTLDTDGTSNGGGFVGYNSGSISDSYATSEIAGGPDSNNIGGFAGYNRDTIEAAFATGLTGGDDVGGFTGGSSGTENDCYWNIEASGLETTRGDATGLTTDQMQGSSASSRLGEFDFQNVWDTVAGEYPVLTGIAERQQLAVRPDQRDPASVQLSQMTGDGSHSNPYVITAADQLRSMAVDPIAFFVLDSDIDASGLGSSSDGFNPIDDFAGRLDGQGNEISGLRIDRENEAAGLFSNTLSSATIANLGVVDVDIVGGSRTGALVGNNNARLKSVYASGRVEAAASNVGGLVGRNNGDISESFSTVTLDARDASNGGGFVGYNNGSISDSYATGEITGGPDGNNIGGFAGYNRDTIEASFAAGLTGGDDVGGFTGGSSGTENDCYWDTKASGLDTTRGDATGLTTNQMQGNNASLSLTGFAFSEIWDTVADEYPVLTGIAERQQLAVRPDQRDPASVQLSQMTGDGSHSNPYVITAADQLRSMAVDPIAFFVLDSDLDASDLGSSSSGFNPIDDFAGRLDGQGNEISGLRINRENEAAGLFSNTLSSATIANLEVVDVDIVGDTGTGAVVGDNNATIRQTYASGRIESNASNVGGLVGRNRSGIAKSFSTVTLDTDGISNGGGFVGYNSGSINDSYATGDVAGDPDGNNVGGFAGYNRDTIEASFATGVVRGDDIGGFTGGSSGTENDCYWDTQASGLETTRGDATGLTTNQMQGNNASLSLAGFDFEIIWTTVTNPPGYPDLQFESDELPPVSPSRTLSATEATPGGEITVTLEATSQGASVTFTEEFSPEVADATITSVTVDGTTVSPTTSSADATGINVTTDGLSAGQTVSAEYVVDVSDDADVGTTYTITGTVAADTDVALDSSELTVVAPPSDGCAIDVTGDGNPASDLNDDSLCEDINGDETFDIIDVAEFLDQFESDPVQNNPAAFNFDGSDGINIVDVAALLDEL